MLNSQDSYEHFERFSLSTTRNSLIRNSIGRDTGLLDYQVLSVLCINCQNMIHVDSIEVHSKHCVKITRSAEEFENQPMLTQNQARLTKIVGNLKELTLSRGLKLSEKSVIVCITRLVQKLLENIEVSQLEITAYELEKIEKHFHGSLSIVVYIDRIKALVQSCLQVLNRSLNRVETLNIVKDNASEDSEVQAISEYSLGGMKKPARKDYVNMPRRNIENIRSEMDYTSSSINSTPIFEDYTSPRIEKIIEISESDMKKHFLSLCLSLKIKHSSIKDVKSLSNHKLYQDFMENSVKPEDWFSALEKIFKHPDPKYFESVTYNRFQSKKKQKFENIIQV